VCSTIPVGFKLGPQIVEGFFGNEIELFFGDVTDLFRRVV